MQYEIVAERDGPSPTGRVKQRLISTKRGFFAVSTLTEQLNDYMESYVFKADEDFNILDDYEPVVGGRGVTWQRAIELLGERLDSERG